TAPPPAPPPVPMPEPAPAPAPAPAPEVATAPPPAPPAGITKEQAKEAYKTARDQYRRGDWIEARKNFVSARDGGYKPGLFEDSPEKYLARMDAKEQNDAAKAAREAAMAQATPPPAPAPAPAPMPEPTPAPAPTPA